MPPPLRVYHWTTLLFPGSLADSRAHRHLVGREREREGEKKGGNERRIKGGMRQKCRKYKLGIEHHFRRWNIYVVKPSKYSTEHSFASTLHTSGLRIDQQQK